MEKPQYTGSQRLVRLYKFLADGGTLQPAQYAAENNIKRQSVYYEKNLLKRRGFPIVNIDYGRWAFGTYEDADFDFVSMAFGDHHITAAHRLVDLYRELVRGEEISPTKYSRKAGVKRQTVYRQFDLLSQAGVPVTNIGDKGWTLMEYIEDSYD